MPNSKGCGLFLFKTGDLGLRDRRGFSLVEIMVVLAIIGGLLVMITPRLQDKRSAIQGAVREIATLTREVHNHARLFNSTYRLVIEMNPEEGHTYWIESAPGNIALMSEEQAKENANLSEEERAKLQERTGFSEDSRILKKRQSLPRGLFFGGVEYGNRLEAINEGRAYIHFFPQGLTEEAVIHLTDQKTLNWSLALHPITGVCDIFDGKKTLKDLRAE